MSVSFTRSQRLLEGLAWLLPLSLAGGSDFAVFEWLGVSWYAFRVVVFLTTIVAFFDFVLVKRKVQGWQFSMLLFVVVWLLWSLINQPEGIVQIDWMKGVFYIAIAGATWVSFYYLAAAGMNKTLVHASVAGFSVNAIVSVVQMLTSIRPQGNFAFELAKYSSEHFVRFAPSGMFGNPNHFAFYVCAQVFLIYTFRKHLSFTLRMVFYVLGGILILFTHSRAGMLAIAFVMLLMVAENRNWLLIQVSRVTRPALYTLIFSVLLLSTTHWVNTRTIALAKEASHNEVIDYRASGDLNRLNLMKCGWEMIQSSNYLGVGSGQFAQATQNMGCASEGISNPHCGFIELTAESGILVFVLFSFMILCFLWQSRRRTFFLQAITWAVMLCLLQFSNSSFISIPIAWCFMAWPLLIANSESDETT